MSRVRWGAPLLLAISMAVAGCGGGDSDNADKGAGNSVASTAATTTEATGKPTSRGNDAGGSAGGGNSRDSGRLSAGAVAKIGAQTISQSALRERLNIYFSGKGKAFGPPRYTGCVKASKAQRTGASAAAIRQQCKLTYQDAATVALGTLVRAVWLDLEARRRGIDVEPDVRKALAQAKKLRALAQNSKPAAKDRAALAIINGRRQPPQQDPASAIRTSTQQEKLIAAIARDSTSPGQSLDQVLHDRYASQTSCQPQYRSPQAPQCQ